MHPEQDCDSYREKLEGVLVLLAFCLQRSGLKASLPHCLLSVLLVLLVPHASLQPVHPLGVMSLEKNGKEEVVRWSQGRVCSMNVKEELLQ